MPKNDKRLSSPAGVLPGYPRTPEESRHGLNDPGTA